MTVERTELEWPYRPADFFEAPFHHQTPEYELAVDAGQAVVKLVTPQNPLPQEVRDRLDADIQALFQLRQLQVHKSYELKGPRVCQHHPGGTKSVAVSSSDAVLVTTGHLDIVHRDAAGTVIHDSKAERIRDDEALLHSVLPNVAGSPLLRGLLASYRAAVEDPANEFVHLYEVKDALVRHLGTEEAAGIALNIRPRRVTFLWLTSLQALVSRQEDEFDAAARV